jgi:hypothetical protein
MDNSILDPQSPIWQALLLLVLTLPFGPGLTVAGWRVLRDPSRIEEKSLVNRSIRWLARGSWTRRNIRFWACMAFLAGIGADLLGLLMLVALIGAIIQAAISS